MQRSVATGVRAARAFGYRTYDIGIYRKEVVLPRLGPKRTAMPSAVSRLRHDKKSRRGCGTGSDLTLTSQTKRPRILLSIPHMGGDEMGFVEEAFATNWLSTVGPNVTAFAREFADLIGEPAVALASGTAAIHLGLRLLGVGPGDEVFCPTLTFVASANPVRYLGAEPVFIDCDAATWNMNPGLLAAALHDKYAKGN